MPAQNLLYADVAGNIGYQTPGRLPIRGAGDGSMPQPGWDSAYDWTGYIPFDALPVSYNPPRGLHRDGEQRDRRTDYPYHFTHDWDYGWRAARIVELIERKVANGQAARPTTSATSRPISSSGSACVSRPSTTASRRATPR